MTTDKKIDILIRMLDGEEEDRGILEAYLEPGTVLRLGQSQAKLDTEVRITADISKDFSDALIALRDTGPILDM